MKNPNFDLARLSEQFKNLNTRDPGAWPVLPRAAVVLVLVLVLLLAGWYFYWSDLQRQLEDGYAQEEKLKVEYRSKLEKAVNLDALLKQKEQVTSYVTALEKQLPSKAEMDALLSEINSAGVGRGLQFELFKPGNVIVRDFYAELPIELKVTGSYEDIGTFVSDLAALPRIVTLNDVQLTGQSSKLVLSAVAKTFRYLDESELEAQRNANAEAATKKGQK